MQRANSVESSTGSPPPPESMVEAWLGLQNDNMSGGFICPLCSRAFSSTQALGGHQNAHRKVRSDELATYIRQRLDVKNNNDDDAMMIESNNNTIVEVGEPSRKRTKKIDGGDEASGKNNLSLDLTLSVGGTSGARENGRMNYNYPDVLFPASEFMDLTVDLDLKL